MAAHDFKTEWVVVKGIKDFVDETQSSSKKWKQIACVMAASVVANILNDPVIFQDWPHLLLLLLLLLILLNVCHTIPMMSIRRFWFWINQ